MSTEQEANEKRDVLKTIGANLSAFFGEVSAEFHRITWPKGKELMESTLVVLFFIVLLSATVLVFDKVIEAVLKAVMGA